jgi:hypothetical protein
MLHSGGHFKRGDAVKLLEHPVEALGTVHHKKLWRDTVGKLAGMVTIPVLGTISSQDPKPVNDKGMDKVQRLDGGRWEMKA